MVVKKTKSVSYQGTGRRKSSVARVYLTPGTCEITVNGRSIDDYLPLETLKMVVRSPFEVTETQGTFDVKVNVNGGGFTGQSQALRLAIARALVKINADDKKALRAEGFMTRDAREVERKKPGQPKARRRFQFSKR